MRQTVARIGRSRGGRFAERPIAMSAEAVMNAQALIDDAMRGLYLARTALRDSCAAGHRK